MVWGITFEAWEKSWPFEIVEKHDEGSFRILFESEGKSNYCREPSGASQFKNKSMEQVQKFKIYTIRTEIFVEKQAPRAVPSFFPVQMLPSETKYSIIGSILPIKHFTQQQTDRISKNMFKKFLFTVKKKIDSQI